MKSGVPVGEGALEKLTVKTAVAVLLRVSEDELEPLPLSDALGDTEGVAECVRDVDALTVSAIEEDTVAVGAPVAVRTGVCDMQKVTVGDADALRLSDALAVARALAAGE